MARFRKRLFLTPADSTAETVYTNTTGQVTVIDSITMSKPSGSLATDIRLSIGTDAATTRVIEYPLAAGTAFAVIYPGIVLTGTEILQLSAVGTDDVVICTGNGSVDLIA